MFIQLGIISYKFIIQLLYPLFYHLRFRIGDNRNTCFQLFLNYSSYTLAGVIYLIVKYRTRETNMVYKENKGSFYKNEKPSIGNFDDLQNNVIIKEINKKKKKEEKLESFKLKLNILGLAILNFFPMFLETVLLNTTFGFINDIKESSTIFFETLFYVTFSRILLNQKIYNHQIFALTIIFCCMSFVFIIYIFEKNLVFYEAFYNLVFFSVIFFFFALYNILGKKVLNHFIISPYYLMFCIGFISLIVLMIFEIITRLFLKNWKYNGVIKQIQDDFSVEFILLSLFSVIIGFFWLAGIWLTIYYFSPCHFIINEALTQLVTNLLDNRFGEYTMINKIICYLAYIIILFGSLIYNEIIIININCMSKDTRKNIIKRQYDDDDWIERNDSYEQILELNSKGEQNMEMIIPIEEE